ncbi:MAG: helix-turn-helix domain-containing protein [Thermoguttaceae bacterium]
MSIVHISSNLTGTPQEVPVPVARHSLQRLAEVRQRQGISRRTVARRLNTDLATVREQECATADLSLSQLYKWQEVLEVPINELLVEPDESLSAPIMLRAQLVRLMKSVMTIKENARQESIRRLAHTLVDQLLEIMPELADVGAWHAVGQRRRLDELGVAAERLLSENIFLDLTE